MIEAVADLELSSDPRTGSGFRLGDWWVVPALNRITGPGGERHLAPRAMDLLVFLAANTDRVVSKEAILDSVWHDVVVADAVVFRNISSLRRLLGDDACSPRFIETIPKRGYRLIAPVERGAPGPRSAKPLRDAPDSDAAVSDRPRTARFSRAIPWLAASAALIAVFIWMWAERSFDVTAPEPSRDARAYELYLDSLAISRDPLPNQRAIELLRTALELDPTFGPAWESLSERLYFHGSYGDGGEAAIAAADDALQRAAEIDPASPGVLSRQTTLAVERGELADAFAIASDLVRKHPERSDSHFALAYVYRYAGLLDDAARECEAALAIEPANYRLRSCAIVFYRLGKFEHATRILDLDAGSEWSLHQLGFLDLHRGRPHATLDSWRKLSQAPWTDVPWAAMLDGCLSAPEAPRTATWLRHSANAFRAYREPEGAYFGALLMSSCARPDLALELLEHATANGYCALSAFDFEPAFFALHDLQGFNTARRDALRCREAVAKDAGLMP